MAAARMHLLQYIAIARSIVNAVDCLMRVSDGVAWVFTVPFNKKPPAAKVETPPDDGGNGHEWQILVFIVFVFGFQSRLLTQRLDYDSRPFRCEHLRFYFALCMTVHGSRIAAWPYTPI